MEDLSKLILMFNAISQRCHTKMKHFKWLYLTHHIWFIVEVKNLKWLIPTVLLVTRLNPQDINKSMTNVFSEQPAAITITKISWNVSDKLAQNESFKNYLQVAGKNLQINLQNDLANTTEFAYNNKIHLNFQVTKNNEIKNLQVLDSSGSEQIDNVVLRSIKETLKYVNAPNLKDIKGDYNLSLVINF